MVTFIIGLVILFGGAALYASSVRRFSESMIVRLRLTRKTTELTMYP